MSHPANDETPEEPRFGDEPFFKLWSECLKQAEAAADTFWGQAASGTAASGTTAEDARRQWLDAVSQSLDQYMRTPAFLQAMKQQLEALVQRQTRAGSRAASSPPANSSASVREQLGEIEARLHERLDRIEERLDAIEWELSGDEDKPPRP